MFFYFVCFVVFLGFGCFFCIRWRSAGVFLFIMVLGKGEKAVYVGLRYYV